MLGRLWSRLCAAYSVHSRFRWYPLGVEPFNLKAALECYRSIKTVTVPLVRWQLLDCQLEAYHEQWVLSSECYPPYRLLQ